MSDHIPPGANRTPMTNEQFTFAPSGGVEYLRYTADGRVFCRLPDGRFVEVIEKPSVEPSVEQFEVKMKAAREANGLRLLRVACTCPSDTELDPRCFVAFPHPWHAVKSDQDGRQTPAPSGHAGLGTAGGGTTPHQPSEKSGACASCPDPGGCALLDGTFACRNRGASHE